MPMPSKSPEHYVMFALIAAAEADGFVNVNGEHLCDPDIVADYAVDITTKYLASRGSSTPPLIQQTVTSLRNQPKRWPPGTAPVNRSGNTARPSLVAVERAMRSLGLSPPEAHSMDTLIRRLLLEDPDDPKTRTWPYDPVSAMLSVLKGMLD